MNTELIRNIIYKCITVISSVIPFKNNAVIILCYHSIASDKWRFSVDPSELELQLKHLLTSREPMTMEELDLYLDGKLKLKKPAFLITFDDGYNDILQTREIFKTYNIKPTVFILADTSKANRSELETNRAFLSTKEIGLLIKDGWSIGCHSATHPNFATLSDNQISAEVSLAKHTIENNINYAIHYFAYPKGRYNKKIEECVKIADYRMAFTMDDVPLNPTSNKFTIPRIGVDRSHGFNEFQAAITPLAVYCRGFIKKYWNKS